MSVATIISVEHLSKEYRLGLIGGAMLYEDLSRRWARMRGKPDPLLPVGQEHHARRIGDRFWALDDVSFEVEEGEVLGIIGRNGAGKSTLLKIMSQVTAPTSGQITLRGRVSSLLEVGTGFHPALTGRENVFLNGTILGMTKAEIRRKFDEIVAFSECEEFIDTPVRRYSSGMYVRLAFAVAAHLESEILIVDEVLAVGDAQFQKKCLGKIRELAGGGRTVLFVSHSVSAVVSLCRRAVLLRSGSLVMDGEVKLVTSAYQSDRPDFKLNDEVVANLPRTGTGKALFTSLEVVALDGHGKVLSAPVTGSDLELRTTLECFSDFAGANVAAIFFDASGYRLVDVNTALHGSLLTLTKGRRATATFRLREVLLKPGQYRIALWLGRDGVEEIDYVEYAGRIDIGEDVTRSKHIEHFPGVYQCCFTHELIAEETAPGPVGQ
jgi:lipopolysaccharide transport system ATP-binding protein